MKYSNFSKTCINCQCTINNSIFSYSVNNFSAPLCISCQHWFRGILDYTSATDESIILYFSLRQRGVPAIIEKNDGFKTIDIAVPEAKVNIEVDGAHHNFDPNQAICDLDRTLYSFKKGFLTLRIPNSLVRYHLDRTADKITEYLNESLRR